MAVQIIWTLQVRDDLGDIVRFVARGNPTAAEQLGYSLMSRVDSLEQFPMMGRAVPEIGNQTIREIVFRLYRIIYQVIEEQQILALIRIWHGARGEPVL
jgi:plasmid stabilization system protein ParE